MAEKGDKLNLLSNISQAKGNTGKITFPNNLFEKQNDYVKFTFYDYKGPFQGGQNSGGKTDTKGNYKKTSYDFKSYNQANALYKPFAGVKTVMLYMPEDISTGYQMDYGGKGFSNVAVNLLKAAGSATTGDLGGSAAAVGQLIKNAGGALPSLAADALAQGINAVGAGGDLSMNDVLAGTNGVILNPNTELMFQGFKLRSFDLNFKLVARNATESKEIREIISIFKKVSLPKYGQKPGGMFDLDGNIKKLWGGDTANNSDDGQEDTPASAANNKYSADPKDNANYIGVPGLCQVSFMSGSKLHPYLPQYKVCAINQVEVNYTPDGAYSTYEGAAPVAVTLQLSFTETKLVYRQDINSNGASY